MHIGNDEDYAEEEFDQPDNPDDTEPLQESKGQKKTSGQKKQKRDESYGQPDGYNNQ